MFMAFLRQLPSSRLLVALSFLLLFMLYPGQNFFQTLIIQPGAIRSYHLPVITPAAYPVSDGTPVPSLTAQSVVVQDAVSKTILYARQPDTALLPASTTKIMTALVALDYYQLEAELTITQEDRAVGQTMELESGEVITVSNLLYGLLVESGNDAALALATHYPGGYDAFVQAMNEKAQVLHLDSTVFKNPSGVESYGHVTTARDLAVLAAAAVNHPVINAVMQTPAITVTDVSGQIVHELVSTNQLLGKLEGVKGLKTGWTERAGECLVTYVERHGQPLITVVLNSADRFGESEALINWAYAHHRWDPID